MEILQSGQQEASYFDRIIMTKNGLEYDRKNSHQGTLTVEHDQNMLIKKSLRRRPGTSEYDRNKFNFRSSSTGNVRWCEFFDHVQIFRSYSFGHLESVK